MTETRHLVKQDVALVRNGEAAPAGFQPLTSQETYFDSGQTVHARRNPFGEELYPLGEMHETTYTRQGWYINSQAEKVHIKSRKNPEERFIDARLMEVVYYLKEVAQDDPDLQYLMVDYFLGIMDDQLDDDSPDYYVGSPKFGVNLSDWLTKRQVEVARGEKQKLTGETFVSISSQVAKGVGVLHKNDLIHADIKRVNVLIVEDEDANLQVKVNDLDAVVKKRENGIAFSISRTQVYSPPEQTDEDAFAAMERDVFELERNSVVASKRVAEPEAEFETQMFIPEDTEILAVGSVAPKLETTMQELPESLPGKVSESADVHAAGITYLGMLLNRTPTWRDIALLRQNLTIDVDTTLWDLSSTQLERLALVLKTSIKALPQGRFQSMNSFQEQINTALLTEDDLDL